MKNFFYVLTFLGGIIGGLILFGSFLATSAPQQGAGAAMAVAFVVIPYCMARVLEKTQQSPLEETLTKVLMAHMQMSRQMGTNAPPAPPAANPPSSRNPFAPKAR